MGGCFSSPDKKQEQEGPQQPDFGDLYAQPDPYAAEPAKKAVPQPVVIENEHAHKHPNGAAKTYNAPDPPRHATPPPQDSACADYQQEQEANHLHRDPIHQESQSCTQVIRTYGESVLSQVAGSKYRTVKTLGKGGFGVVSLCERTERDPTQRVPQKFALKELISPKVYPLGKNENIRDYLPLNEAAIQRYMRHSSIVETYWADVRCLHPETGEVLDVGAGELDGKWTPIDHLNDIEKTYEAAERKQQPLPYKEVKLQMRIAMEHCDLGSVKDYLVDSPEKQGTRTLVEMLKIKRRLNIEIDPTLCALLTSLDIAEALKFMHKSKTLHGDLKPHNILLVSTPQGSDYKGFRAKISDFGLSQHMTKDQNYVVVSKGTEAYLPLEVFQQFALTEKSDVYAMGLLMWEIFYGIFWHAIYEEEKKRKGVKRAIDMGDYHPSCNSYCPKRFADVVHQCVRRDPSSRPTAADIVTALNECIAEHSSGPAGPPVGAAQRTSAPADVRPRSRSNGAR